MAEWNEGLCLAVGARRLDAWDFVCRSICIARLLSFLLLSIGSRVAALVLFAAAFPFLGLEGWTGGVFGNAFYPVDLSDRDGGELDNDRRSISVLEAKAQLDCLSAR